ncbi:MAG: hypothetical protein S4CHLAM20_14910 [Chlamydiia bacterium]|nr:hypothetical protein [Chlamydiia bacterium]
MGKIILRGLLAIAPLAITIILVLWLYNHLEYIFGAPVQYFFPEAYFPGLGIIIAIVILFFLGLIINNWIIQSFYNALERTLKKIPLLKTIYTSVTDLMSFFNTGKNSTNKPVMVNFHGVKLIGLITRETFDDLPKEFGANDQIAVFLPFSYQVGGSTVLVPRSMIIPLDMSVEKSLRFVATGGSPSHGK